jgi:hypothetical protein
VVVFGKAEGDDDAFAAQSWIVRISGESTTREFLMYWVERTGSTGRLLYVRVSQSLSNWQALQS